MNLTASERATATHELEQAGIQGSDLASSLRVVCALVGDIGYDDWLATLQSLTFADVARTYGTDLVRAVWVLRNASLDAPADPVTFTLRTEWTGSPHTFTVEVWPSRFTLLAHLTKIHPAGNWDETNEAGETAAAAFINSHGFMSNDAPEHLGTIYLNAEHLDINTTCHEIVHAALFAYDCDLIGNHTRARVHMNGKNETVAYLIGNLLSDLVRQLLDLGLYESNRVAA